MKFILQSAALVTAIGFAVPAAAQSACAQFEVVGTSVTVAYNPFSSQGAAVNFAVKITRQSPSIQSVRFLLVDGTGTANGAKLGPTGPADYDIRWVTNTSREVFVTGAQTLNPNNGATVSFANGGQGSIATTNFQLVIPRGQSALAGRSQEDLSIRYQCVSGNNSGTVLEQMNGNVTLRADIPQFAAAYIGGTGQVRGTLDFGTLGAASGDVRRALSITALSTVAYGVTVSSANAGRLKRATGEADGVAYTMEYGGRTIANGATITCPITPAPSGRSEEFAVTVDGRDALRLPAGEYRDTITLTFRPRDGFVVSSCQ